MRFASLGGSWPGPQWEAWNRMYFHRCLLISNGKDSLSLMKTREKEVAKSERSVLICGSVGLRS
jgi:hypothetical protein